ncbi:MAG TPA: XdhC/CoxI family protein [Symbiobacteriaceae bacterium]|nr:XdhC/CoxI family protein [Symbiobacteriaceae bacterium]
MADHAFLDLDRVRRSGRKAVLATIVRVQGPAYRRAGASAVIAEDGEVIGAISAGCLDADIRENALQVIAGAPPRLLHYNTGTPEDLLMGTRSGCGGLIHVLVAPVADEVLSAVASHLSAGEAVVVSTDVEPGPNLGIWRLGSSDTGFVQTLQPPVTLLICGAGDDARPLAQYAAAAGFRVIVCDHRPAWVTPERFPNAHQTVICECATLPTQLSLPAGSYAVLLTHQFEQDIAHLEALLERPLAYIGLLGARERSAKLIGQLLTDRPDLYQAVRAKLHAPVGLDIGADGPAEIALSIAAELVAHRAGRPGTPLSAVHS